MLRVMDTLGEIKRAPADSYEHQAALQYLTGGGQAHYR